MIVAILVALLVSAVIYFLADLAVRKMSPDVTLTRIVWFCAIVLIVLVWWVRVIAPLMGPLP